MENLTQSYLSYNLKIIKQYDDGCTSDENDAELCDVVLWCNGSHIPREMVFRTAEQLVKTVATFANCNLILHIDVFDEETSNHYVILNTGGTASTICISLQTEMAMLNGMTASTITDQIEEGISKNTQRKKSGSKSGGARTIGFIIPNNDKTIN